MNFTPVIIGSNLSGWNLLKSTQTIQKETLSQDSQINRQIDNFRKNISNINTVSDLVGDRRILTVALGSVGLEDDIDSTFFIQKIIEEGVDSPDSLSNLLSDTRYRDLAKAFEFLTSRDATPIDVEAIISNFIDKGFQVAVGEQNADFRLALNLEKGISKISERTVSNDAKWFSIMGSPPIRKVFEVTLSLPSSVSNLSIDDQLDIFKERSESILGSAKISDFSSSVRQQEIVEKFLLKSQISSTQVLSSNSIALSLIS